MNQNHRLAVVAPTPVASVLGPENGAIEPQLVTWLEDRFDAVQRLLHRTTHDLVAIGRLLAEVKARLAQEEFLNFIKMLGLSRATAYRWMRASEAAAGCSHIENVEPSALYALGATSTPEEVREAFLARADAGHRVTLQEVQTTLKQGRTGSPRPAPNLVERLVDGMVAAEDAKAGRDWRGRDMRAEHIAREIGRYGEEHRAEVAAAVAAWSHASAEAASPFLEDGGRS